MDDQSLNLPEEQVGEFTDNTAPQPSASGGYEANEVSYEEPTSLEGTPAEETFSDSATPESFEATPSSENMTSDISESTEVPTEGSSPADSMPDAISYDTPQEMAYEANEDLSGPEAYETTPQEQTANEVMPDMSSATDSETPEVSDATPPITEQQPSQMEDPDDVLTEFGMEYPQETDVEETAPAAEVMAASPNSGAGTPSSPLVAPANGQNNNVKIIVLVLLTIVLLGVLAGTIWYFFLRDTGGEGPSTTPTPTQIPQPTSSQDTHLECRFGLCVEVPGPGDN
ncbi:hypothetical protein KC614_00390, partial [candidate division WWE3 bacterium]|nr:hypothetical protein [candidate division WWE3 bacterium]